MMCCVDSRIVLRNVPWQVKAATSKAKQNTCFSKKRRAAETKNRPSRPDRWSVPTGPPTGPKRNRAKKALSFSDMLARMESATQIVSIAYPPTSSPASGSSSSSGQHPPEHS